MGILRADRITGLGGANAITGSTFFSTERQSLTFDGSDINFDTGDFTVEAWIFHIGGNDDTIISDVSGWTFAYGASGALRFYMATGSNVVDATSSFISNEWVHVAVVRSSGTLTFYQNGTAVGSHSYSHDIANNSGTTYIGKYHSQDVQNFTGYISNFRIIQGRALYTGAFTPPTSKLEKTSDTVLLTCNSASDVLNEETGKYLLNENPNYPQADQPGPTASRFTPNSPVGFSTTTDVGSQHGTTFDGFTVFATSTYMVPPGGNTRERNRGRGLVMGGGRTTPSSAGINNITFIEIHSGGNAQDFGDLTEDDVIIGGSLASSTRGIRAGGFDPSPGGNIDTIDFVTIANTANATNFGDLIQPSHWMQSGGNQTRGVMAGGNGGGNVIQYITIATAGDSQDFGDLINSYTTTVGSGNGAASPTRLLFAGGTLHPSPSATNIIQYVTIASTGDAVDFGDLTDNKTRFGVCSSETRGLYGGGGPAETDKTNTITFVTLASTGNTVDFGDRIVASNNVAATSNATRGVFIGGGGPSSTVNTIDFVTISTTGNATDFGDNVTTIEHTSACSDSHGGIS